MAACGRFQGVVVPVSAGAITATAADGTIVTLTIPANALLSSERITMTPVSLIERLPLSTESWMRAMISV